MQLSYYPVFLFLLLITSCSLEDRIERREDRLVGTWEIDRASYKGNNDLFGDNVTSQFSGDRVEFYPDYSLVYETGTGVIYDGYWSINALREPDDETEFTFDADFFDFQGRPAFQWLGTIDKLNRQRFKVTVLERAGTLRLRWCRR
ncbi:hypothetical protein [Lewinella sp. IMCC34183]|uniref:hypothetical protein n=1 Tax=Lewinella sp. IMCC34183 TaxID=2248762 RepID=UPI001300BB42|nr:hypothetical protein [Lewinella sp. IMCC34183]